MSPNPSTTLSRRRRPRPLHPTGILEACGDTQLATQPTNNTMMVFNTIMMIVGSNPGDEQYMHRMCTRLKEHYIALPAMLGTKTAIRFHTTAAGQCSSYWIEFSVAEHMLAITPCSDLDACKQLYSSPQHTPGQQDLHEEAVKQVHGKDLWLLSLSHSNNTANTAHTLLDHSVRFCIDTSAVRLQHGQ